MFFIVFWIRVSLLLLSWPPGLNIISWGRFRFCGPQILSPSLRDIQSPNNWRQGKPMQSADPLLLSGNPSGQLWLFCWVSPQISWLLLPWRYVLLDSLEFHIRWTNEKECLDMPSVSGLHISWPSLKTSWGQHQTSQEVSLSCKKTIHAVHRVCQSIDWPLRTMRPVLHPPIAQCADGCLWQFLSHWSLPPYPLHSRADQDSERQGLHLYERKHIWCLHVSGWHMFRASCPFPHAAQHRMVLMSERRQGIHSLEDSWCLLRTHGHSLICGDFALPWRFHSQAAWEPWESDWFPSLVQSGPEPAEPLPLSCRSPWSWVFLKNLQGQRRWKVLSCFYLENKCGHLWRTCFSKRSFPYPMRKMIPTPVQKYLMSG